MFLRAAVLSLWLLLAHPLRVHLLTFPAHGHYMTLRDIGRALLLRGHDVTYVLCEGMRELYERDGLDSAGARFLSAGNCHVYYSEHDDTMRALLASPGDVKTVASLLDGVARVSEDMCATLAPRYAAAAASGLLPDILVFDGDTFCGANLAIRFRLARVARVGTGPRDAYRNPVAIPLFGTALPLRMSTAERLINAALLSITRFLIAPMLLPRLMARGRTASAASAPTSYAEEDAMEVLSALAGPPPGSNSSGRQGASGCSDDEKSCTASEPMAEPWPRTYTLPATAPPVHPLDLSFAADLPWDGVPTLYNSHWGLEHARPMLPFEHMVGHTTDFAHDAAEPLADELARWLALPDSAPVVYVGLGTLSVLPPATLAAFSTAMTSSQCCRFVWAVPAAQQEALPTGSTACSEAWRAGGHAAAAAAAAPGCLLLVKWAPQLAVLSHGAVAAFWTHGGMNGVAEGSYARTPMLCSPLFSDQPDNCQRLADRGMGLRLNPAALTPGVAEAALRNLTAAPGASHFRAALDTAWLSQIAAGGLSRAVDIIEATAAQGYAVGRDATVPRDLQPALMPWSQRHCVDIAAAAVATAAAVLLALRVFAICSRRGCCAYQQ